jgi:hypothetical protein
MTLSTTLAVKRYDGDGSTTAFPTTFKFEQNSHIQVVHRGSDGTETDWVENTHYTLSGAGSDGGGTATALTSPTDYTPATGETVVISRSVPEIQETDYPEGGAFPAFAHEQALDLLTMMLQQHSGELTRALLVPVSDPDSSIGALPNATERAAKFLAFDGAGVPMASDGPVSGIPVSTFMETVLDDADANAARTTLGLGAAAVEVVATGGSGDLLRADGDGSSLTGIDLGATDREVANIMLNSFRIQQVGGLAFQNMIDGFADEFENEDGIDTGTSANQTYDATGDYYDNRGAVAMIAAATGSVIGDFDTRASAAFDGNTAQASAAAAFKSSSSLNSYIGKNFSAAAKKIDHAIVYGSTVEGFSTGATTMTVSLYGKNGSAPGAYNDGTLLASNSVTDGPSVTTTLTAAPIATWDYVWVAMEHSGSWSFYLSEIEFYERGTPTNMTLISAITANPPASSPDSALVVLWHEAIDSLAINTDLSTIVTRDGGANWSTVTLLEEVNLGGGQKLYVGSVDLSGQPAGTNIRYAFVTVNNKEQRFHAVALEWGA